MGTKFSSSATSKRFQTLLQLEICLVLNTLLENEQRGEKKQSKK